MELKIKLVGVFFMLVTGLCTAVELPLKNVTVFSSGVAFYEHEIQVDGNVKYELTFNDDQIDDFLKSVAITDAGAKSINLEYASSDTVEKTLQSLPVDLSRRPTLTELLKQQIGSNITVSVLRGTEVLTQTGRLLSVEKIADARGRGDRNTDGSEIMVSIASEKGLFTFDMSQTVSFQFSDAQKNEALFKALQLLDSETSSVNKKKIVLNITGSGKRTVKVSYVLGAPVWKTTYRLNLGNESAVFQAWAIVDNSTNMDWNQVNLCLITGKPVSFRQRLYEPYYVVRPEIPLPIEEAARLEMYDSTADYADGADALRAKESFILREAERPAMENERIDENLSADVFTGEASELADSRFVFTPAAPVSLARQKSMMLPIKVTTLPAKKMTVFSDLDYQVKHPKLCVQLTNTSGINLPAGAITLYDESYAGDSMIAFLPKNETRLISYGDDLLLSARMTSDSNDTVKKVSASGGILEVAVERLNAYTYTVKNNDTKERTVIIEHDKHAGYELAGTAKPIESTLNVYRFSCTVPANKTVDFVVNETRTLYNKYTLLNSNKLDKNVMEYVTSGKAPTQVTSFFKTLETKRAQIADIKQQLAQAQAQHSKLSAEQERTRKNMEALAGTPEVASFTKKLLSLEEQIVSLNTSIENCQAELEKAQADLDSFIRGFNY